MEDSNKVPESSVPSVPEKDLRAMYADAVAAEEIPIVEVVAEFYERFVFLKDKSLYRLLALWTIATFMYMDFDYMGYIFACSPEPESGKSRLLEVLYLLVANSSGLLISPSEAVLFRTSSRLRKKPLMLSFRFGATDFSST